MQVSKRRDGTFYEETVIRIIAGSSAGEGWDLTVGFRLSQVCKDLFIARR
jgi:hypothetical protein